jgi:hypothetical protein
MLSQPSTDRPSAASDPGDAPVDQSVPASEPGDAPRPAAPRPADPTPDATADGTVCVMCSRPAESLLCSTACLIECLHELEENTAKIRAAYREAMPRLDDETDVSAVISRLSSRNGILSEALITDGAQRNRARFEQT